MARSKGSSRSRRMSVDWVVNEDTYGIDSDNNVPVGGIVAVPLTYPKFMFEDTFGGFVGTRLQTSMPEQKDRQFVKMVRGVILTRTSSWVSGDTVSVRFRIVKKPMDFFSGAMVAEAGYDLWRDIYANERYAWQFTHYDTFVAGTTDRDIINVSARVNQSLEPDEALWLVADSLGGAAPFASNVRLDYTCALRTLMKAD